MAANARPTVKKQMAAWYDPRLLAGTGIRTIVSSLFGEFADKREAIAASNAVEPTPADGEFDYSKYGGQDFWFDYLADTGDGWNPTFAMARLVAKESLLDGKLPRGRLLILGGDQVYPTASKEEYRDRFVGPFDHAYKKDAAPWPDTKEGRPHLYAIPGNHDWYDGLNSFFGLFCRRRVVRRSNQPGGKAENKVAARAIDLGIDREGKVIGGRQTQQTRSYFAIQLPGNWWVWGTDSQLEGYIDQPQIDYFQHAAAYWMKPGSKLILCVADPSWAYVDPNKPDKKFDSFAFLERLASITQMPKDREREDGWPAQGEAMAHVLKLVLTGDSHHYCRYVEHDDDPETPARHYIVCGGGGAFLHPTHHLRDSVFNYRFPKPGSPVEAGQPGARPNATSVERAFCIGKHGDAKDEKQEAMFPDRKTSASLSKGNFAFAVKNKWFVFTLFCIYGFFNWILDFNAGLGATRDTMAGVLRGAASHVPDASLWQRLWHGAGGYWDLVFTSPWSALLVLISLFAYTRFADSPHSEARRWVMGGLHALAQALAFTLVTVGMMLLTNGWFPEGRWDSILSTTLATLLAAIASGTVFGLYLFVCIRFLRRHPNEGFSSMAIEDFKSFLRLKVNTSGVLTIYPIGLRKVPKNDDEGRLDEHLIEPAIEIA